MGGEICALKNYNNGLNGRDIGGNDMNRIKVNHHGMNYNTVTGVWLMVHMIFGSFVLDGCYKLKERIVTGWLFLVLGTVFIIWLMYMLDKSQALVVWDEKTIRIKYHRHTDIVDISQIEAVSYSFFKYSYGRYGSRLKLEVNITASGCDYSVNDNVSDELVTKLIKDGTADIPLMRFYRSIRDMRPETDMGFVENEKSVL